jgi:UDP-glucose:tetrahydrobiopterin glucosyltransferase
MLKLLFISTPLGPLGSGLGGGVELTLTNIAQEMIRRGRQVEVIAPQDSFVEGIPIQQISGNPPISAQNQARDTPIILPVNGVLGNMWTRAYQSQSSYDILLNFAYDWLPFYLTPFFPKPLAHLVSMGSLTDAMDLCIRQVFQSHPHLLAFHTQAQASTFGIEPARCLTNGLDLSLYDFSPTAGEACAWVGRISPEKALEDALEAVKIMGIPLKIFGKITDQAYWERLQATYRDVPMEYQGFLPTALLQKELGSCRALLMTHRWVEAFGNVVIEALACGVPVITYRRGGPGEIVRSGETGWLVEPDSIAGLVTALGKVGEIERSRCRQQAEAEFSLPALGERVENWFQEILS